MRRKPETIGGIATKLRLSQQHVAEYLSLESGWTADTGIVVEGLNSLVCSTLDDYDAAVPEEEANAWEDVILPVADKAATDKIDTGEFDRFITRWGSLIEMDYQVGEWVVGKE